MRLPQGSPTIATKRAHQVQLQEVTTPVRRRQDTAQQDRIQPHRRLSHVNNPTVIITIMLTILN